MNDSLTVFLNTFTQLTKKPYEYLSIQEELSTCIKDFTKQLYDYTKCNEKIHYKNTLPKLIVERFDEEQIWQELELQNKSFTNDVIQPISQLSAKKDKLRFPVNLKCFLNGNELESSNKSKSLEFQETEGIEKSSRPSKKKMTEVNEESEMGDNEEEEEEAVSDLTDENFSDRETKDQQNKAKLKPSIVDDKFFKLAELELFLQNEERNEDKTRKEKETFDLFYDTDQEPVDYKYSDFFANPEEEGEEPDVNDAMENSHDNFSGGDDFGNNEYEDYIDKDNSYDTNKTGDRNSIKRNHHDDDSIVSENEEDKRDSNKHKRVRFSLLGSDKEDSETESDNLFTDSENRGKKSKTVKSTLEERQERLSHVIGKLEEEALSEKPWQLSGEVSANVRPQNSLLEEAVDFDVSVRPAPVITGEVTLKLEDIIIQRIKDKAWDDVERKVKPVDTPSEFKKKLALDQEKSKLSLAEVYEQEFIKQREAATKDDTERQETEPPLHTEVRSMLQSLFNKLDALSNYHYTPRPVAPELKVVSNVAAITMEEVAPVTVADSALLAPQEIKGKKQRGVMMSKEERTDTDKKRARRLKKVKQRQRQRAKAKLAKDVAKVNPGLGNKYSKLKAQQQVLDATNNNITKMDESKEKTIRSSTSFFNKLQDEVKNQIKSKSSTFTKKKDKRNITAKKLKL